VIVAGFALALGYLVRPELVKTILHLLLSGNITAGIEFIRSFGPYAMLVSFGLIVLINSVAVLPNIFFLAANGIVFGVVEGTLLSWLAECTGTTISFLLIRYLVWDYVHKLVVCEKNLRKIDQLSGEKGFRIMLIARAIPYMPSGLITALGALSSIRFKDYVLATLIGKLPSVWLEVTLGHDLLTYRQHSLRLAVLALISAVAYYLVSRYYKRTC